MKWYKLFGISVIRRVEIIPKGKSNVEIEEPILKRWYSKSDVRYDADINKEIIEYIDQYEARSTAITRGIIGCPHEEGIDYPEGEVCPECPFWAGRDRWAGEDYH
jgi:hypothetical protein